MKTLILTLMTALPFAASAQMVFQENFELTPADDRGILGRQNGWRNAWNDDGDSLANLVDMNLNWEAPFASRGMAIQITNSQHTAFRELPGALNGQTLYFSFLFRFFTETGGTGQLRFRTGQGHVLSVGFTENQFSARAQNQQITWGSVHHRENYFVAGEVTISEDGSSVRLTANTYTTRASIPLEAPVTWAGIVEHDGPARRWNGVEFMAASQNVAFDDLRIGKTWRDVAGTRR
ncbi:MAG: hypothetical protein JJU05_04570 [Verrucomicrobia bacterium]|nr:hypothetical protein [Verrucomicrobiota bacterium]MCH8525606.1 hypothetical protein [Kiritimatiellia bacterium]